MKICKRTIAILLLFCTVLLSSCGLGESALYVKSTKAGVSRGGEVVITVEAKRARYDISGSIATVELTIGIGGRIGRGQNNKNSDAFLVIKAPGCTINGKKDECTKYYDDYYRNDIYKADIKQPFYICSSTLTPNYFEKWMITFPAGKCVGEILFTFSDLYEEGDSYRILKQAEAKVYYTKNDELLILSSTKVGPATLK